MKLSLGVCCLSLRSGLRSKGAIWRSFLTSIREYLHGKKGSLKTEELDDDDSNEEERTTTKLWSY
jgi:hypothetical protein